MIVIEHCMNCRNHQWNTRHNEARYSGLFSEFHQKLKDLGYTVKQHQNPRLGSFEVSLGQYKLFSKLETGLFPDVPSVVKFIHDFNASPNKQLKYQELKSKKLVSNQPQEDGKQGFRLPSLNKKPMGFSPMKHRSQLKQFSESKKMSHVLGQTRREANYSSGGQSYVYTPGETAKSNFYSNRFNETSPNFHKDRMKKSQLIPEPEHQHHMSNDKNSQQSIQKHKSQPKISQHSQARLASNRQTQPIGKKSETNSKAKLEPAILPSNVQPQVIPNIEDKKLHQPEDQQYKDDEFEKQQA